jgi:outer membrane immunogenic protein
MKTLLFVAAGALALGISSSAGAADLARPYTKAPPLSAPIYNWSGFYVGINGGGGSAHTCYDYVVPAALVPVFGNTLPQGCHDATGGTVGGQVGYRWQSTNWVFGVEGQGNWADFSGSNATPIGANPLGGGANRTRIDAFGLLTGQIGYAWSNVLLYVKGGAAVVSDKYDFLGTPGGAVVASANDSRWGGTVGAGLEVGFAANWSVGVEYNHIFLSDHNYNMTTPAGVLFATERVRQDVDMGLVRVNYRFGGPIVAKY